MSSKLRSTFAVIICFILCAVLCPAAFAESSDVRPVTVLFDCIDENALSGLHVMDEAGNECAPTAEDGTDAGLYGHYLLTPGEYLYRFHDEDGRYEDFDGAFTVDEAIRLIIPIDLTPVIRFESFSFTYIDPFYEDIIAAADIPEVTPEQISAAEQALRELASVQTNNPRRLRARQYWNNNIYYDNDEEAALFLRSQIGAFQDTVMLGICSDVKLTNSSGSQKIMNIWYTAIAHTGTPTEGDYLRYEYGGFNVDIKSMDDTYIGNEDGLYYYMIPFSLYHYTNADQEAELTPIVNSILASFDLEGKNDLQKVIAIYDYLCSNVTYDNVSSGNLKRTAYAALVNHTAVCQGYSAAFYRLCLTVGVDTRMITCSAISHAWNIVQLNGLYYELDATWDAGYSFAKYRYLLKGSAEWLTIGSTKHGSIGDQYNKSDFASAYPLSVDNVPIVTFSSDGGSAVLPQYILSGDAAALPVSPTKAGYWFTGWYADSSFSTLFNFSTAVTADTTIYARWAVPDFVLPSALAQIGEEAFSGGAFSFAVLPENAVTIGPMAFADCDELVFIYIPDSVTAIDSTAFGDLKDITVLGTSSAAPSAAETFASTHGYAFVPVSK